MGQTAFVLTFDEATGINPQDLAKNLGDLVGDPAASPALAVPAVVAGYMGNARSFGANVGLVGAELVVDSTRLTRDMSVEAIVSLATAAASNGTRVICARGKNDGSTAERPLWGLQVVTSGAPGAPVLTLQQFWQQTDGTDVTDAGVAIPPPSGSWVYIAAARRWTSPTSVACDYYVNGQLVGSSTVALGAIGDGAGGTVTIGCRGTGAHAYTSFWADAIDQIRVSNVARTAEEIRQTYLNIFVRRDEAYQLLQQLLPEDVYSEDPSSQIQRELMVEGDVVSIAVGLAAELDEDYLPDRATRTLSRWESVLGIAPSQADNVYTRRNRVLGYLRQQHGFTKGEIAKALAVTLGMTESQVQANLVEVSNRYNEVFGGVLLGRNWQQIPGGGSIAVAGHLSLSFAAGHDCRMIPAARNGVRIRMTIPTAKAAEIRGFFTAYTLAQDGDAVGIYLRGAGSDDLHMVGIKKVGGVATLFSKLLTVAGETVTTFGAAPGGTIYLRMLETGAGGGAGAALYYSTSGWEGPWTLLADQATIANIAWGGVFLFSNDASPASGSSLTANGFRVWAPNYRGVYRWYVFADPLLTSSPDLAGAQQITDKIAPAHTKGTVVRSASFLCDDPYSLCDRDILGA